MEHYPGLGVDKQNVDIIICNIMCNYLIKLDGSYDAKIAEDS